MGNRLEYPYEKGVYHFDAILNNEVFKFIMSLKGKMRYEYLEELEKQYIKKINGK